MQPFQPVLAIGWLLASLLISVVLVRGAIAYARRRGMLDQPGQRRSHTAPTPRGGGVGMVVAALAAIPGCLLGLHPAWPLLTVAMLWVGLLLVAAIGWWDDHRALPAAPRFAVQMVAVVLFGMALLAEGMPWPWLLPVVLAGAGSINLHNFMDGTDGLLAQQAMFVFAGLALLAAGERQHALTVLLLALALACAGFWFYNRAPARIFMGDVGSGSIGFLVFAVSVLLWRLRSDLLWPAALLSSAFATDATLTLLMRVLRGRRWYSAHREHLYQWLVRSGLGHAQVATAYLGWNMLVAAPLAALAWWQSGTGWWVCAGGYLLASLVWMVLKRRCVRRIRSRERHVVT